MKQQTEPGFTTISVLSVGPAENSAALQKIFAASDWSLCPQTKWTVEACGSVRSAVALLRSRRIAVVLCESDLGESTWQELLEQISGLPHAPSLIVTSRLADERLWAEALNLGAYDVLATPFHPAEVERTLSMAWLRRQNTAKARPPTRALRQGPVLRAAAG